MELDRKRSPRLRPWRCRDARAAYRSMPAKVGSGRADGYEFARWIEAEPLPRFQDHAETSESDSDDAGRPANVERLAPAVE